MPEYPHGKGIHSVVNRFPGRFENLVPCGVWCIIIIINVILFNEQQMSHSASHTLAFIEENYVDDDDDAPHTTWDKILKATREPIYN